MIAHGVSGLDDKLVTHLLLEPIDVSRMLLLEPAVMDVVTVAVVVLVAVGLVVVVVVVSPLLLLFCVCGRTTLVESLSMDGSINHWFGDYVWYPLFLSNLSNLLICLFFVLACLCSLILFISHSQSTPKTPHIPLLYLQHHLW